MEPQIFKRLAQNPVTKAILARQNNIGNLYLMEEALVLVSAFLTDKKHALS